jgi:hypothetical protein
MRADEASCSVECLIDTMTIAVCDIHGDVVVADAAIRKIEFTLDGLARHHERKLIVHGLFAKDCIRLCFTIASDNLVDLNAEGASDDGMGNFVNRTVLQTVDLMRQFQYLFTIGLAASDSSLASTHVSPHPSSVCAIQQALVPIAVTISGRHSAWRDDGRDLSVIEVDVRCW